MLYINFVERGRIGFATVLSHLLCSFGELEHSRQWCLPVSFVSMRAAWAALSEGHGQTSKLPLLSTEVHSCRIGNTEVTKISFIWQGKYSWWYICVATILQRRQSIKWQSSPLRGVWCASSPVFSFTCSLLSWNIAKILFRIPWHAEDNNLKLSYYMSRRKRKVLVEHVPQAHKNIAFNKDKIRVKVWQLQQERKYSTCSDLENKKRTCKIRKKIRTISFIFLQKNPKIPATWKLCI